MVFCTSLTKLLFGLHCPYSSNHTHPIPRGSSGTCLTCGQCTRGSGSEANHVLLLNVQTSQHVVVISTGLKDQILPVIWGYLVSFRISSCVKNTARCSFPFIIHRLIWEFFHQTWAASLNVLNYPTLLKH